MNSIVKLSIFSLFLILAVTSCSDDKEPPLYPQENVYMIIDGEAYLKRLSINNNGDVIIPSTITQDGQTYNVVGILNRAFSSRQINSIHIPPTLKKIEASVFYGQNIKEIYITDLKAWCNIDFEDEWMGTHNPSLESNSNPISTDTEFFVNGEKLITLILPESVMTLKKYVFRNLNITGLVLSDNLIEIGESAFENCKNLKNIKLGESLTYIGERAFQGCVALEEINLNESLKTIEAYAFQDSKIKTIEFPATLEKLGVRAFYSSEFETVYIPENLKQIGLGNFMNTIKVSSPSIEDFLDIDFFYFPYVVLLEDTPPAFGVQHDIYINGNLFEDFYIPENINVIKNYIFSNSNFITITIPSHVNSIGGSSFENCKKLENLNINTGVEEIRSAAFYGCSALKEIIIPEGIKEISFGTFNDCSTLAYLSLPASLTDYQCSLENCNSLKTIVLKAPKVPKNDNSLYKPLYNYCNLYVPEESIEAYRENRFWGVIQNIYPLESLNQE